MVQAIISEWGERHEVIENELVHLGAIDEPDVDDDPSGRDA